MNEYLVLPGCDDTNRGDQALIWETVELAKEAGFEGHYSMISSERCGEQSRKIGIDSLAYLLPHPSAHTNTGEDNRTYGIVLKFKWAMYSMADLLISIPLSMKHTRRFASRLLDDKQKKTLEMYEKAKAAFVKGGGFLHAYGGVTEIYKIYFFLYHINLAHSMGIPVYVMPNSYGPFVDVFSKKMVEKCLKKCRLVYSRESISQELLNNRCHVSSRLACDLAMYLGKDEEFDGEEYIREKGIQLHNGRMVGITVRPYRFPGFSNADQLYSEYKTSICKLIIWLKARDYHPVMIEHVYSDNYHERDIICINEINEMLKASEQQVDVFSALDLNCKQMKSIYSLMDYLVGTRFHSVIFSLTEMVPAIAITYGGNKGEGIMKDLGLSDYAIPIESINSDVLCERFESLLDNQNSIISKLESFKKETNKNYQKMLVELKEQNNVNDRSKSILE